MEREPPVHSDGRGTCAPCYVSKTCPLGAPANGMFLWYPLAIQLLIQAIITPLFRRVVGCRGDAAPYAQRLTVCE